MTPDPSNAGDVPAPSPEGSIPKVHPWPRLSTERGPSFPLFAVRRDVRTNPRTGQARKVMVLETAHWVNVVALTPGRELVLVRQFRFGSEQGEIEIPGGVIDASEEPQAAAERELREETGFTAARWSYLGAVQPNPAFHDNLCHHFLAEQATQTHTQHLDPGEDIACFTLPLETVRALILKGLIRHSLVLTALSRVLDLRVDPAPCR